MVGGMSAGVVSHVAGGIGHFRRYVENRVGTVGAASLGDWSLEVAYGDIRGLNVLFHRLKQWIKVEAVPSVALVLAPRKPFHRLSWNSKSPFTSMAMQSVSGQSGELRDAPPPAEERIRICPATYRQPCWFRDETHRLSRYAWQRTILPAPKPQTKRQRTPQSTRCDCRSTTLNDAALDR